MEHFIGRFTFRWHIAIVVALSFVPLFLNLDRWIIREWDEARLAANAIEMAQNHNYLVTHFEGKPDLWNTKPPLLIWMQALGIQIFGIHELAIRLPSALAGMGTILIVFVFVYRYFRNAVWAYASAMLLATSHVFIGYHACRTGDYDAMLVFFTILYILFFYRYFEVQETRKRWIFSALGFASLLLAVLTKGVAGFFMFSALMIYLLIQRRFFEDVFSRQFMTGFMFCIAGIFAYYFLREISAPGYMKAVYENELGGRFLKILENHKHENLYYFNNLKQFRFSRWMLVFPIGVFLGFFAKDDAERRFIRFLSICLLVFFVIISVSRTKLEWYDLPMFPLIALLSGYFIQWLAALIRDVRIQNDPYPPQVRSVVFMIFVFAAPYNEVLERNNEPGDLNYENYYRIDHYFKNACKEKKKIPARVFAYKGYPEHHHFYLKKLRQCGQNIRLIRMEELKTGDSVVVCQSELDTYIAKRFISDTLYSYYNIRIYALRSLAPVKPRKTEIRDTIR
jgi:hypothetical protein